MTFALSTLIDFLKDEAPTLKTRLIHSGFSAEFPQIITVSANSKDLNGNAAFFALIGSHTDAHQFISSALEAGSPVIFVQTGKYTVQGNETAAIVEVTDTHHAYALACALVEGVPARSLRCIGVTGTNGKTTVTHLIERILKQASIKTGLVGTLGITHGETTTEKTYADTGHTTPMANVLQGHLAKMKANDCDAVIMEVSSHALHQHRSATCDIEVGVITNLTQDHLDYHITMEKYADAKALLFSEMSSTTRDGRPRTAVINADDAWAQHFVSRVPEGVAVMTFGINDATATVRASNVTYTITGSSFDVTTPKGNASIQLKLAGEFSIYNALAALSAGLALGVSLDDCKTALEAATGVIGRFEVVHQEPHIIVDYAHTPDGLENILEAARQVLPEGGRLITLFGCGGDRDATKRPKMAAIAERLSDALVVTSDNPRSEDPDQIIADVLTGIEDMSSERVKVQADRRKAIYLAIDWANPQDIVVLAGKGHETYQILADRTIDFDDKEVALAYINEQAKAKV